MKTSFLALAFLLFPIACSLNSPNPFKSAIWEIKKNMRQPGAQLSGTPDRIWRQYRCGNKKLPFVQIISNEVIPIYLAPGEKINHRFIYVMCAKKHSKPLTGPFYRRIYSKEELIFEHEISNFEFHSGQWIIDAFIKIPPQAKPGAYTFEMSFNTRGISLKKPQSFSIFEKD